MSARNPNAAAKSGNRTAAEVAKDGAWIVTAPLRRPKNLSPAARKIWDRTVKAMPDGVLTALDQEAMRIYCETVADYWECAEVVKEQGRTVTGSTGNLVRHPLLQHMSGLHPHIVKYSAQLGLTPLARQAHRTPLDQVPGGSKRASKFGGLLAGVK